MPEPIVDTAVAGQDPTPVSTKGFGARESADETRQAQQQVANDAPVDVNPNAVVARSQVLTVDVFGKVWSANADRREKLADAGAAPFKA